MKSCRELQEKLLAFMKGEETPPFKRELIEKHLKQCKACHEEYRLLEKTDLLLETARLPAPKNVPDRILARISQSKKKSTRRVVVQRKPRNRWAMPVAAAILLSLVVYFALRTPDPARATLKVDGTTVLLTVESGTIDLKTPKGRELVNPGDISRIQKLPNRGKKQKKTEASRYETLAWASYTRGAFAEALVSFRKALDFRKKETPASKTSLTSIRTGMGWGLYWNREYEEASTEFKTALEYSPDSADAQRGLGYCRFRMGDYELAVSILKPVGKAKPSWIDVQLTLGWAEYWQSDYPEAIGYFNAARKLNPFLAEPSIGLGWAYYKTDQPELARSTFANALTLYPDYFENKDFQGLIAYHTDWLGLQLSVAWAYYNKMNYDRAEEFFLSFLEKLGEGKSIALVANSRCGLGWTLYQKGMKEDAEKQFDLALKIAPSDSNALLGKELCMRKTPVRKEN